MKPAPFDYVAPATIDEALEQLSAVEGAATIIAGGQTLMPLLNLRMNAPLVVLDINRIAALKGVTRAEGGVRIGAMVRQAEALNDTIIAQHAPVVRVAVSHVGHHQTRNRGTIGGSIALGEPAAELPATAVALGASIEARSVRGTRRIAAEAFYVAPYVTVLEADELLTAIHFPDWPAGTVTVFREVAQRPGDFALVGLVGALALEGGKISRAGLAWFGMGPTPIKARQAEQALIGQAAASLDLAALGALAVADTEPFDDHHASAEYRRTVGRRVFARALGEALKIRRAA